MSAAPRSLTPRQREVLDVLIKAQDATGVTPSFQEIADAVGLGAKSGVHRIISALEKRGWIERLPNCARAIRILRRPGEQEAQWLIWSVRNGKWWKPGGNGYTRHLSEAGHYTRDDALRICVPGQIGWGGAPAPTELPVRLEDAETVTAMAVESAMSRSGPDLIRPTPSDYIRDRAAEEVAEITSTIARNTDKRGRA